MVSIATSSALFYPGTILAIAGCLLRRDRTRGSTGEKMASDLEKPPEPQADPEEVAPIEVRASTIFNATLIIGGLLSCGLVGVMLLVVSRNMPRRMDARGLRLRNGKRFGWADLTLKKRVAANDEGMVLGYDLIAPDGTGIRLAEGAFADGAAVVAYALDRMAER
jgi:hypothetical protein